MIMKYKEYLAAAARSVAEQIAADPALYVPLDPDVADYMGCLLYTSRCV